MKHHPSKVGWVSRAPGSIVIVSSPYFVNRLLGNRRRSSRLPYTLSHTTDRFTARFSWKVKVKWSTRKHRNENPLEKSTRRIITIFFIGILDEATLKHEDVLWTTVKQIFIGCVGMRDELLSFISYRCSASVKRLPINETLTKHVRLKKIKDEKKFHETNTCRWS